MFSINHIPDYEEPHFLGCAETEEDIKEIVFRYCMERQYMPEKVTLRPYKKGYLIDVGSPNDYFQAEDAKKS